MSDKEIQEPVEQSKPKGISRFWQSLTGAHPSIQDIGQRSQAQLLAALALGISALMAVAIISSISVNKGNTLPVLNMSAEIPLALVAYTFSRSRHYRIGTWLLAITLSAGAYLQTLGGANMSTALDFNVGIALVLSSALLPLRSIIFLVIANVVAAPILAPLVAQGATMSEIGDGLGGVVTLGIVVIIVVIFRNNLERRRVSEVQEVNRELQVVQASLEQRVYERTAELTERSRELSLTAEKESRRVSQLRTISEVAHRASLIQNLEELLPTITRLISERFGYYHVGIFLLDQKREYAVLQTASSQGGQRMLKRGHKLRVGQTGIVGYVTAVNKPRTALNVGEDAVYFNNPDLPDTRSELALPLTIGERVIGALDVQSTQESAFTQEDIEAMRTLADQVAIAIENARLLNETRRNLTEAQTLSSQYLRQEWNRLSTESQGRAYRRTPEGTVTISEALSGPEIANAIKSGRAADSGGKTPSLAIPVKLGNETIGMLDIRSTNSSRRWTEEDISLLQAVADRVALALDNARLLQDSQRRASKERTIGEITSKFSASVNLRNILKTAVEELGHAIPDSEVTVQFQR